MCYGLVGGTIPEFFWKDRGKQQETMVSIDGLQAPVTNHIFFSCQQYITTVVEEALVNNLGIKASHNMQFTQCHEYKMKDFFIIISGPLKVTAHPVPLTLTPLLIQ